jgi:hypothetical protein
MMEQSLGKLHEYGPIHLGEWPYDWSISSMHKCKRIASIPKYCHSELKTAGLSQAIGTVLFGLALVLHKHQGASS